MDSAFTLFDGPRPVHDTVTFRVNQFGAPREIADSVGVRVTLAREQRELPGLVTSMRRGNFLTTMHYGPRGNPDTVVDHRPLDDVDARDAVTRIEWIAPYDEVTKIVRPEGDSVLFSYDEYGNRRTQQNGPDASNGAAFDYDPASHLLESIAEPGLALSLVRYDSLGNVSATTTPGGQMTLYLRDALGRPTEIITPTDAQHAVDSASVAQYGLRHKLQYDFMDRVTNAITLTPLVSSVSSDFSLVATTYDAEGRVLSVARSAGIDSAKVGTVINRYRYDLAVHRVAEVAPDGLVDSTVYDAAGNPTTVLTRRGDRIEMIYDARNRLTNRTAPAKVYGRRAQGIGMLRLGPSARVTPYPWYPNTVVDGDSALTLPGESARFVYDALDRITAAENEDALVRRSYYSAGMLRAEELVIGTYATRDTTAHRYQTRIDYDLDYRRTAFHQPAQLSSAEGTSSDAIRFAYDSIGQLSVVTGLLGEGFTARYNNRGDRIQLTLPGGLRDSSAYDFGGRLQRSWMFNDATVASRFTDRVLRNTTLSYDGADRVLRGEDTVALGDTIWNTYSPFGQLTRREFRERAVQWPSGYGAALHVVERFSWDPLAHLGLSKDSGDVAYRFGRTTSSPASEGYVYERLAGLLGTGRLRSQTRGGPIDSLVYDASGNLEFRWTGNCGDNTVRTDRALYYDSQQRLRVAEQRSTEEAVLGCGERDVNAWNQQYEEYRYDALGRRVLVRRRTNCERSGFRPYCGLQTMERIVWDGALEAAEIRMPGEDYNSGWWENDTAQVRVTPYTNPTLVFTTRTYGHVLYAHAPGLTGIDQPLAVVRLHMGDTSSTSRTFVQYAPASFAPHWDWKGNADVGTAQDGSAALCAGTDVCNAPVWARRAYSFVQEQPQNDQLKWYGSAIADHRESSGLLFRRARYVDALSNQFTQEDPIGLAGGMNLYGYAGGDPVNYADPFGLCPPKDGTPCPVDNSDGLGFARFAGAMLKPAEKPLEIAGMIATAPLTASGEAAITTLGLGAKAATFYRGVSAAEAADFAATGSLRAGAVAGGNEGKYLTNSAAAAAEWAGAHGAGGQVLRVTVPADATRAFTSLGRIDGIGQAWWAPMNALSKAKVEVFLPSLTTVPK